ncbi:MAG: hypothetical protein O0V67_05910 [Methanocorpusculum sp.]|nr:hypothetical protein [Methanocorpusculum sp.]
MPTQNFLYKKQIAINDVISIVVPTVGEIIDNEDAYYGLVSMLTAMPIDLMVQLDDAGIDFTTLNEWELFLLLFGGIKSQDTHQIFGDLDLSKFKMAVNEQNGNIILLDDEHDIRIDRVIHTQIANVLRKIHHLEKNTRKPANEEAKKFMIERARVKQRRNRNRKEDSQLETLIIAMVNTEQYKYDFESTRGLSIFQFNESVRQIINKVDYEHRMYGVYTGTINAKELSQDELNWLKHK